MTRHDGILSQRTAAPGCVPEDDGFMHELAPCGDVRRAMAARFSVASLSAEGEHISVGCWPFACAAILCRKNADIHAPFNGTNITVRRSPVQGHRVRCWASAPRGCGARRTVRYRSSVVSPWVVIFDIIGKASANCESGFQEGGVRFWLTLEHPSSSRVFPRAQKSRTPGSGFV